MRVAVLGVDTPIGLAVVRDLGKAGHEVHAIVRQPHAIGTSSRWVTRSHVRGAGPLKDWLAPLLASINAQALMAIGEADILELDAMPETLGNCRVLCPRGAPLRHVIDKATTLRLATACGIDVPRSWQPEVATWRSVPQEVTFPVVLKWSDPHAASMRIAPLGIALEKTEYATSPEALLNILARYEPAAVFPLVQEYCTGYGLGQMICMHEGQPSMTFQHRRIHEWPPEGGTSTVCASLGESDHADQMRKSVALLQAIGWNGPAMVEYRHDPETGRFVLMEINGRFWGSQPLASRAGRPFAVQQLHDAFGLAMPRLPRMRAGIRCRYMVPEVRRLIRVLAQRNRIRNPIYRATPWRDLGSFLTDFVNPSAHYYVFQLGDPGPFLRDLANMTRKALRLPAR